MSTRITLIDNHDSFVYNLVDAFAVADMDCTVYRNTVPVEVILAGNPDLIVLSPGPGHPREAGTMMELLDAAMGRVPILGICLGFQAIIEHLGGHVGPVGAVHGVTDTMTLTDDALATGLFEGVTIDSPLPEAPGHVVPIARYHSLGCTQPPAALTPLATTSSAAGDIVMAGIVGAHCIGLQFHPESMLTPGGPHILQRSIDFLLRNRQPQQAAASAAGPR